MVSRTRTEHLTNFAPALGGFPARSLPSAPARQQDSSLSGTAYTFLLVFLFLAISRILDFTVPMLHLPLIMAVIAAGLTFVSGGVTRAFSTTVGKLMGLFTLWFVICVPFSQWKAQSLGILVDEISRSFLVFVMVANSINTLRRIQSTMAVIGIGTVVTMGIALAANHRIDGRLTMSAGQYSNPNDLAQIVLLGMCFLPALAAWRNNSWLKWLSYLIMLPCLYTIFITGSRSGLITVLLLSCFAFLFSSAGVRLMFVVGFPALVAVLLAASPTARLRLNTIIHNDQPVAMGTSEDLAISSASARLYTLQQSLELTLRNPLFGVGPGAFQSAAASEQHADGQKALWVETHNAYTQVSSETGIPGALFFTGAVLVSLRELWRIRRRTLRFPQLGKMRDTVTLLMLGFMTFAATSIFSSVAYGFIFWSLLGLCAASIATLNRELAIAAAPAPQSFAPLPRLTPAPVQDVFLPPSVPQQAATRVTLSGRIKPVRKPS